MCSSHSCTYSSLQENGQFFENYLLLEDEKRLDELSKRISKIDPKLIGQQRCDEKRSNFYKTWIDIVCYVRCLFAKTKELVEEYEKLLKQTKQSAGSLNCVTKKNEDQEDGNNFLDGIVCAIAGGAYAYFLGASTAASLGSVILGAGIGYCATRLFGFSGQNAVVEHKQPLASSPEATIPNKEQLKNFFLGNNAKGAFDEYNLPNDLKVIVNKERDKLTLHFDNRRLNKDETFSSDEYDILNRVVTSDSLGKCKIDKKPLNDNQTSGQCNLDLDSLKYFRSIGERLLCELKKSEFGPKVVLKKKENVISFVEPESLSNTSITLKDDGVLDLKIVKFFLSFTCEVVLEDLVKLLSYAQKT